MRSASLTASIIASIVLSMMLLATPISGEQEPNDSLDDPDLMDGIEFNGSVSQSGQDVDVVEIGVPASSVLLLKLKKTDTNWTTIELRAFDHDKVAISGDDLGSSVSIPGEAVEMDWVNDEGSATSIYAFIEGTGSYRLSAEFEEVIPEDDWHSTSQDAEDIDDGTYTGVVHSSSAHLPERHFYSFDVPASSTVKVSLNKTGGDDGTLKLYYDYMYYVESDAKLLLTISEVGENETGEFDNTDLYDETYFLLIEGTGEYTLTVEIEDGSGPDISIIVIIMLILMILISLAPIVIIIIIIVIIVIIVKRSSSKKHADIISRSTTPGPAYPPQDPPPGASPPSGAPMYHYPPPPGPQVAPPPPPPPPKQ